MSNRIVPQVYRAIIDEVMANIKSEFEEFGVDDDVLAQLQNKWETKVVASNVAQFEPPAPTSPPSRHPPIHPTHPHPPPPPPQHHPHMHPHHPPHPSHPSLLQYPYQPYPPPPGYPYPYAHPHPQGYQLPPLVQPPPPQPVPPQQAPAPSPTPRVKTEDDDNPKHGTFAGGGVPLARVPQLDGEASGEKPSTVDGWDGAVGASTKRKYSPLEEYMRSLPPPPQAGPSRLPQLDGSSDLDPASPPLQTLDDGRGTEEIGSDLDDSDDSDADDVENEGAGEAGDYVFCTYDKVQRVKNKWKCVLKDGMIHVNGKDYLFMKCNGLVNAHSPLLELGYDLDPLTLHKFKTRLLPRVRPQSQPRSRHVQICLSHSVTKLTDRQCHIVDAPPVFDEAGAELGSDAQVWKTSGKETDEWDGERVDGWNKTLDVILIFAALFSAISTAFVLESYKNLKDDPADVSAQALRLISQTLVQLANKTQTDVPPEQAEATKFKAPKLAVAVNILWILSLSLSVAVSLVAMLAKEWCFTYMSGRTGSPAAQARRRQQRLNGLIRWKMKDVLLILPSLIQTALLLFAIGLSLFLWDVDRRAAVPVIVVAGFSLVLYIVCTVLPFLDQYCPYNTTLPKTLQMVSRVIIWCVPGASIAIYKHFGTSKRPTTDDLQDRVTSHALHWMITNCETPRSVDVALQSIAGASDDLPVDVLKECDALGLIRRRFLSLDTRGPNPNYALILYSRAMLYLEGTLHPAYAIPRSVRTNAGRLEVLMWSMQLEVESLLNSYRNEIPLGWCQQLADSCAIFTLQGAKALQPEPPTNSTDRSYPELETPTVFPREDRVRIAKSAMAVLKQDFQNDIQSLSSPIDSTMQMSKHELTHAVFSLLLASILVHDQWTLQQIDFPMCFLRSHRRIMMPGVGGDGLALALVALALSRQAYPGWTNPCPLSAADRVERVIDMLLYSRSVSFSVAYEGMVVSFAEDARRLGIMHLLSRPELYGLGHADIDVLISALPASDNPSINIPTLPPDFNLHRQIMVDLSNEITGQVYHYFSHISHDHAHTKAILELLRNTYSRETVGPPPTPVYLFVLRTICESPNTNSDHIWRLFESFSRPSDLGDAFAKELAGSYSFSFLRETLNGSGVKCQLLATSQLWLITALLGRQDTDSDIPDHKSSQKRLKENLVRNYGPETVQGADGEDAQYLEQTKANLVSRFVGLLPNCPEVVPYLYNILRCMLLEENAPQSDLRWNLFSTADMSLEQLAEEFSHISLPGQEQAPETGQTEPTSAV